MHKNNNNSDINTSTSILKIERLLQLFYISGLAVLISMVAEYSLGHTENATVLLITLLLLLPVKYFTNKNKLTISSTYFLTIITLSLSFLMLTGEGIKDIATLAYPVILIFSITIGNRNLFLILFTMMFCTILFITYGNETELFINNVNPINYADGIIALCILLTTAYSTWALSEDHNKLFKQLNAEKANAVASQQQVKHAAHHDGLTGLPNRLLAVDRFNQATALASRGKSHIALMYIDLDNFKLVNDTLGHEIGDEYLKVQASRLSSTIREVDTVCRQGGDEFLILLNEIKDYEDVIIIAEKIISVLSQNIALSSTEFEGSGSIGISMWPDDGDNYDTLLQKADMAMYHAKDTGRNNFQFYDEKLNANLLNYLEMVTDLKIALDENQFELYYQPKISLSTDKIIGAEALIRWHHPKRGLILPDEFIPTAEQSGLIVKIGRWIINEACAKCKSWQQSGYEHLSIAVNVSPIQFMNSDVYSDAKQALEKNDFCASKLELEITESLLLDESIELKNSFNKLYELGVKLSIDDFGTGYSNLKYLKLFHISLIKIDQSFILDLDKNNQDQSIVKAIIQMAKSLNMKVVAEGVENTNILEYLKQQECDYAQGYLWSKSIENDKFKDILNDFS